MAVLITKKLRKRLTDMEKELYKMESRWMTLNYSIILKKDKIKLLRDRINRLEKGDPWKDDYLW